ncbi:regulator of microtubule dynamics protein 1 isoform X4 [Cetorhinus maximus]
MALEKWLNFITSLLNTRTAPKHFFQMKQSLTCTLGSHYNAVHRDHISRLHFSTDGEILWRLARASRDLAQLENTSMEKKKQLTYEALEFAKKALEKNELSFAAHKWYAICISDVGDYEGTKAKIANAYVIKEHFQKAIELNPKDATSIHLMGLWCFTFAELPWIQQKIAAMFFATPPSSTYKEALQYFNKAEEADPNFYSKNLLMMGKTYMKLKNEKLALLWLTKARDYPARNEEDKQVQKEATELLKSIKRG